jgi:hypothetical protein
MFDFIAVDHVSSSQIDDFPGFTQGSWSLDARICVGDVPVRSDPGRHWGTRPNPHD